LRSLRQKEEPPQERLAGLNPSSADGKAIKP
jgi:hypothetical protein